MWPPTYLVRRLICIIVGSKLLCLFQQTQIHSKIYNIHLSPEYQSCHKL